MFSGFGDDPWRSHPEGDSMSTATVRIEFISQDGSRQETTVPVSETGDLTLLLGRGRDVGVVIPDETVSRNHASLSADSDGRCFLKDLKSRAGTSLNWMLLDSDEKVRIRGGDRISLGGSELMVSFPDGDGPDDPVEKAIESSPPPDRDEFQTRGSLLLRLNSDGTHERELGWQDFYDRYVPLIMGFARRTGARDEEAEDVAHEVMANFFRASNQFEYDPSTGRFRGYLKAATLNTLRGRWRKQKPMIDVDAGSDLPIEDRVDADEMWEREWTRNLITRALTAVKWNGRQSEQSWEAFELYGRRGVPIEEVSSRLGMNPDAIRQAKSRISRQVRAEIERIRSEEG